MPLLKKLPHKLLYLAIPVIILVVIGILELTNVTHFFHSEKPSSNLGTASSETKGEAGSRSSAQSAENAQTSDEKNGNQTVNTGASLRSPTGNFVSNHKPSLSQNDAQTSSCTTTPGATCQVIFTKDGQSKYLSPQTTDQGGSTFWNWKPKDVGLTAGTWQVQLKATFGGQSQIATDALPLEVSP